MKEKVNKVNYKGTVENRSEAQQLIKGTGDFVLVKREIFRVMILRCPCGCGDDLLINLDKRSGPAWRMYSKAGLYSLYPSYWRETACESHFVLWNNKVCWFSNDYDSSFEEKTEENVEEKVLSKLKVDQFMHYTDLADECDLVPWECLRACKQLYYKGLSIANDDYPKEYFRKIDK